MSSSSFTVYAWEQQIPPIGKFVLVAIANSFGDDFDLEHAVAHAAELTGLSELITREWVEWHVEQGHIIAGETAYRVNELPSLFDTTPRPKQVKNRSGYVYLIQSPTGAYKIGRTVDPESRMRTFGVQLPFEVEYVVLIPTDDTHVLEAALHERFADKRINGEWFFNLTADDVAYIKSLAEVE